MASPTIARSGSHTIRSRRRQKYGAKRVTRDGETFDSLREAKRHAHLRLEEASGRIRNLRRQVIYYLWAGVPCGAPRAVQLPKRFQYRADHVYELVATGETVVEDSKGMKTPLYTLKKALVEASYGIRIIET